MYDMMRKMMSTELFTEKRNEMERKMSLPTHFHDIEEIERQYRYGEILKKYYRRNSKYFALYEARIAEIGRVNKNQCLIKQYPRVRKSEIPPYYELRKMAAASLYGQAVMTI